MDTTNETVLLPSIPPSALIRLNELQINKEFLQAPKTSDKAAKSTDPESDKAPQLSNAEVRMQMELFVAILNGYHIRKEKEEGK